MRMAETGNDKKRKENAETLLSTPWGREEGGEGGDAESMDNIDE